MPVICTVVMHSVSWTLYKKRKGGQTLSLNDEQLSSFDSYLYIFTNIIIIIACFSSLLVWIIHTIQPIGYNRLHKSIFS